MNAARDEDLARLLASARRRLADATPHGPEWAAAVEAVVELDAIVTEARRRRREKRHVS